MSVSANVTRTWQDGQTGAIITKTETVTGSGSTTIDLAVPVGSGYAFAIGFDPTKVQGIVINADVQMTVHFQNAGATIDIPVGPTTPHLWTVDEPNAAAKQQIVRAPTGGTVDNASGSAGTLQIRVILNVH